MSGHGPIRLMEDYDHATYGDRIAEIYDDLYGQAFDVDATVETLTTLAGAGPALELAIGTGRIALPLAARGVEVHGIDASEEMVRRLREKKGGESIPVSLGDFADIAVAGSYSLIFVVFNTFFALESQDEQVRCFANVAGHLASEGVFVIEAFVPDLSRFDRDQRVDVTDLEVGRVMLNVSRHDAAAQRVDSQHISIEPGSHRLYPVRVRYAWPSELDLMARLAGLRLRHRWAAWDRSPFTSQSTSHVSVYERIPGS
jgi:SAM-dependent methyltransferase